MNRPLIRMPGRPNPGRSRAAILLLWCGLPFASAIPAFAQFSTIVGRVVEDGTSRVMPGVEVILVGTAHRIATNDAGRFTFTQLGPGTYRLQFRYLGYGVRTDSLQLGSNDIAELEVSLAVSPVSLPPIAVTASSGSITAWLASKGFGRRGLDERAMLHMTDQQLTLTHYQNLRDLLRNVPGVRIRRLANAGSELLLDPNPATGTGSCKVDVYLNGSNVEFGRFNWTGMNRQSATRPIRFDDLVRITEVDGIELYGPEDNPVASDSTCGTLMIWSHALRPVVDEYLTGEIHGRAMDSSTGDALAGVRLTVQGTGLSADTDANGRFEILAILPGRYRVTAEYPQADPWEETINVRAYGVIDLDLRIERRDRLVDPRGPAPIRN